MRYTPIFDEKGVQEALARLLNVLELKDEHKYEREHSAYGFWARTWYPDHPHGRRGGVAFGLIGQKSSVRFTVLRREEETYKVGGIFLKRHDGAICAAHSGKFDSKNGKSKRLFTQNTEQDPNWVKVEEREDLRYLITALDGGIDDAAVLKNISKHSDINNAA